MRTRRLLSVVLTILAAALVGAPAAGAEAPLRLSDQITDHAGVLSGPGRAAVQTAVDKLYADRHMRLWVAYVDVFSGQTANGWANSTARLSELGDYDALLAVATADRSYAFLVSRAGNNLTAGRVDNLRRDQIEPALARGDWAGAAVAAADGLDSAIGAANEPMRIAWLPILAALAGLAVLGIVLMLVTQYLRRRRRAAELAAAQRIDPADTEALARLRVHTLDDLSRVQVVAVDNAVRTSRNELELAVEEFGSKQTQPFSQAVENARRALAHAFTVRQQLDDTIPETPAQRRDLLTGVIVSAGKADHQLEEQRAAFRQMRDLVINAPSRLDTLTQQVVALTARIPDAQTHLAELYREFDATALSSVSGNVKTAKDRIAFSDRNISRARELVTRSTPEAQGELVDSVRAAESAIGQAETLLDAIDSAATDIRHAVAELPATIADAEAGINEADARLRDSRKTLGTHAAELTEVRDRAVEAVAAARTSGDPLGAFTRLTSADAGLDRLLDTLAEEQAAAERLARTLEQALFTARSRVRGVSDYIDTRRGSIGPEARTRLAEARRRLDAAETGKATDVAAAITDANAAATLAAQAQSAAKADVQAAQDAYYRRHGGGGDTGAMLGGIIIGNILGGGGFGGGGGGGGWRPTSFGGSGGGGFLGGGGRF